MNHKKLVKDKFPEANIEQSAYREFWINTPSIHTDYDSYITLGVGETADSAWENAYNNCFKAKKSNMVDITKIKPGDKVVFYEDGTLCTVVGVDGEGLIVKAGKKNSVDRELGF